MLIRVFLLLFICLVCQGYIPTLNESEYNRMPPLFSLDPYDACLHQHSGVYCSVKIHLVSDQPSELMTLIQEYSARTNTHYNHSQLLYGICLTKTCKKLYEQNVTLDQNEILEACLNETFWKDYGLKTRIIPDEVSCEKSMETTSLDTSDLVVGIIAALVLIMNIVGSLRESCLSSTEGDIFVNRFLSCFSIQNNWKRLEAGTEPRLTRLRGISGIRTITTMLVITCHSGLPFIINSDNPRYFEEALNDPLYLLIANGTPIIQNFFIMSGFLLAYNLQLHEERRKISWNLLPMGIVQRWVRLVPSYAVVLAVISTWLRHAGSGPLWPMLLNKEINDCRRDWWLHLLQVNNYVDDSYCLTPTWYIAADFQLTVVGLIVCVLLKGRIRKMVIALLFLAGFIMPAAHTYFQDLDGVQMVSPEISHNLFIKDPTFNHTYKRGHTNLSGYMIGIALGFLVYHWQKTEFKFPIFVRHPMINWLSLPAIIAVISLGDVFYSDKPRMSVEIRAVYAGLIRPVFSIIISFIFVSVVFKWQSVYRGILEWKGWGMCGRLCYCAYLIHVTLIKYLAGTTTVLVHTLFPHMVEKILSAVSLSFIFAIPLHLLVEAPSLRLQKLLMGPAKKNTITTEIKTHFDNHALDKDDITRC